MRKYLAFLWKWSWVVTAVITVVFLYWTIATAKRYYVFRIRYKSNLGLQESGITEFRHMMRQQKNLFSASRKLDEAVTNGLRNINLFVSETDLAKLNSHLPQSGFKEVKGKLWNGDKLLKVKVRYRGDFIAHWGYHKKSLRVKTTKESLFEGMRKFNLIAPKFKAQINSYLGYRLAQSMGLVVPKTEMVNVLINGRLQGVYILVEQLEEITLRRNNLLPGDLYAGELLAGDGYTGISTEVFDHPGVWEKQAFDNKYPPDFYKPLAKLTELINAKFSDKVQDELIKMLDLDVWGRFAVFETLSQTFHYDNTHNWRLYYDPARGVFIPVVWDPVSWAWLAEQKCETQLDIMSSRLHSVLFRNYDFLRARHKAIEDFFDSGKDKDFLKETDMAISVVTAAIDDDPGIRFSQSDIIKAMKELRGAIEKIFSDIKEEYLADNSPITYFSDSNNSLTVSLSGRCPVECLLLHYLLPPSNPVSVKVRYFQNGQSVEKNISGAVSVNGNFLEISTVLLPRFSVAFRPSHFLMSTTLDVQPASYEFLLTGLSDDNRLLDVFADRGSVRHQKVQKSHTIKFCEFNGVYNIISSKPVKQAQIWREDVEIDGFKEVYDDVIIEPGTTIKLKAGATLIIYGRFLAEGTLKKPICFIPFEQHQEPWGSVVLFGSGANDSKLSYCEFAGGSGVEGDLLGYSAMFSLRSVSGIEVKHCLFRDNKIFDDMVHSVYSEVYFSNCKFLRAAFDAFDSDIGKSVIENCLFVDSGNDAIDAMTSEVVVINTLLQNSGDKGISVGEKSKVLAINTQFVNNNIGLQSKDDSIAVLCNVDMRDNLQALDAYMKNWRYGRGGDIFLYKGCLVDNKQKITADKKSGIWIYDTYMTSDLTSANANIILDSTVDSKDERKAESPQMWRFPREIDVMKKFDPYWREADAARRGAAGLAAFN
ncbi:MAG: hypothetical protein CVV39_02255 [Planctomycetes bacterium HGW-Planctomycetes-1]|nr:MAG: hypothetical protein CVV39_02255 [Planctomycetes bacterium HGW-Planctomycetes-1]